MSALIHRSRGRPSNRGKPPEVKEAVLSVYQQRYWDFGPTLAAEKAEREGYQVEHETLRRWLMSAGLRKRHRKRSKHRNLREQKAHFRELVQMDGSHHQWFSGHKGRRCLMDMVDDATGRTLSLMRREETTKAAMEGLELRDVVCLEETRVISNDWVARYKNCFFQIVAQSELPLEAPIPHPEKTLERKKVVVV